jgi:hypothetical protein
MKLTISKGNTYIESITMNINVKDVKPTSAQRASLDDHAELASSCQPKKRCPKDGITFEIWLMLKNKTKSIPGFDDRDKWTGIYRMLCPLCQSVPDPCKVTP